MKRANFFIVFIFIVRYTFAQDDGQKNDTYEPEQLEAGKVLLGTELGIRQTIVESGGGINPVGESLTGFRISPLIGAFPVKNFAFGFLFNLYNEGKSPR